MSRPRNSLFLLFAVSLSLSLSPFVSLFSANSHSKKEPSFCLYTFIQSLKPSFFSSGPQFSERFLVLVLTIFNS
ncbi:hypothetical protein P8452_22108 [Trifolium repens]|nr:hypothetical protein P8452_22108 [Trifolium repens]